MKKILFLSIALFAGVFTLFAQPIYNEAGIRLYHTPSKEELDWAKANNIKSVTVPTAPPSGQLRPIAEFEPAEAVLIAYPSGTGFGIPVSLIKEMAKDTKVITIVSSTSQQSTVLSQYNSSGVNTANCEFLIASLNSYWTRDYGPWFMAIDNSDVAIYDFNYNRDRPSDNQINTKLATYLSNNGVQINRYASTYNLAGGNFMNDGTSQAASSLEQFNEDNPGWTASQIQAHFLEYMGIEQYNLLNDALGAYINHIDCWGKYLAPDKVMIGQVPSSNPRYAAYEAAANFFANNCTSPYGTPMRVYRVYTPGTTSNPTPYTNSLILNKKVFVPQTGNSNDAAAIQSYKNAMPGYEVFGINYNYWESTDALHCRTHEIADRCMLYIKHQPRFGEIANTGNVNFSAELYSYCNNTIYSDSVIVYIKSSNSDYVGYNMVNTSNNTWEVSVSGLPSDTIKYYIFAADESGRRECHPYIGAPDPHKFILTGTPPDAPVLALDKTSSSVMIYTGVTLVKDTITISNLGTTELTFEIDEIEFPVNFTVTPVEGALQPDNSQILILTYDFNITKNINFTKEDEVFTGSFKLRSNDPIHSEIEITLHATVFEPPAPVLSLDKTSSAVSSEGVAAIEDTITISNAGNTELTFEIAALDFHEMLSLSPRSGVLQPDESQMVILSYDFANVEYGEYTGSFKLLSNDPTQQEVEVSLYAHQKYVGIKETNRSATYIYPNPASDKINIVFNGEYPAKANIYNILGVQLKETTLTKGNNPIDIKTLPKGIYFIKIEGNAFKFVKQ